MIKDTIVVILTIIATVILLTILGTWIDPTERYNRKTSRIPIEQTIILQEWDGTNYVSEYENPGRE